MTENKLKDKSLFSNETLDSIAMAETYGGLADSPVYQVLCKENCPSCPTNTNCPSPCCPDDKSTTMLLGDRSAMNLEEFRPVSMLSELAIT